MKKPAAVRSYAFTVASILSCIAARGQVLFQDNFDSVTGPAWTINSGNAVNFADVHYDYSTLGVPLAPRSTGTTRIGAFLQANNPPGAGGTLPTGISISPTGQAFAGDYQIRYDLWQNYNGPLGPTAVGGQGSTQLTGAGLLSSGNVATFAGAGDGIWFAATGDGGTTQDYRAYVGTTQAPVSVFAGAAQNSSAAYYAGFGGKTAPAEQLTLQPGQTGTTPAGALGFAWHDVAITKVGNIVTWDIDNVRIATLDVSAVTPGGSNILFAQSDINTGTTTNTTPPLLFGLIDNVSVTAVPEPSTYALVGAGALLLAGLRRRK